MIDAGAVLPLSVMAVPAAAFEESALPWKVDIVDRHGVSEAFGRIIDTAPGAPLR